MPILALAARHNIISPSDQHKLKPGKKDLFKALKMENIEIELIEKLRRFRDDPTELGSLQYWLKININEIERLISPGVALKLCSRDIQKVMSAIVSIVPPCSICGSIARPRAFTLRQEHRFVALHVEQAILGGFLSRIKSPAWLNNDDLEHAADAYFNCGSCGAIWTLVEPEREYTGQWQRLA